MITLYNKKLNSEKLLEYGFEKNNDIFVYETELLNGDFRLIIEVQKPNVVKTQTIENETGEIYFLHLTSSEGEFVGKIREEYNYILKEISDKCFDVNVFKADYTLKVIEYIRNKYNDEPEFLWEKFPDNAIARRKDNKKWYIVFLTITKDKLGLKSKEIVEIIDLRADKSEIENLIEKDNIYPGYHMNKQNWITIILDGSVDIDEIYKRIDESYILAQNKNKKILNVLNSDRGSTY